ncbi:hypothetical protein GU927_005470 [Rhodobacteraceae bacterium HSP-20]|uniref:Uncharacterized protein n=1 Tax=Paragemmobacter amnigenus TaxID=2852097 RepID=A0ABS6J131_9RHOB|nr:hypothetical protein [Rhodobacter amnigenus]MBU9697293.1 hypothetical protein [Rhodobacter amnigenus]MBV4388520.1 hypothetical protein [Rhodobacter amnigenus]
MDISKIRALLGECFQSADDPRGLSAEEDYHEAETALRALKSLFERELESRGRVSTESGRVLNDRKM